jgi:flagellar transcriptional activator FlhD
MNHSQMVDEIREINLSYLMLAQRMLREDREQAMFRLGLSAETADLVAGLTTGQILKIAASNLVLCRFRFTDELVWNLLAGHAKDAAVAAVHASVLMTAAPAEAA